MENMKICRISTVDRSYFVKDKGKNVSFPNFSEGFEAKSLMLD